MRSTYFPISQGAFQKLRNLGGVVGKGSQRLRKDYDGEDILRYSLINVKGYEHSRMELIPKKNYVRRGEGSER